MKRFDEPILVTRPYLPDVEEFKAGVDEIWRNRWLTNNGPMLQKFQKELAAYLNVPETNLALFNNGTLALELGYYAMGLAGGEVITTPFTFVATSHALKRIGATPVFADIDPETLCLDPAKVEKLITPRTKAIVPVHVYGHVCDIEGFNRLAEKYGIPVIYDAAHAFGVPLNAGASRTQSFDPTCVPTPGCGAAAGTTTSGRASATETTIGVAGAMSMFSFHPTKLFHSCEGGLLVFRDAALQQKLYDLRNFAIHSETVCVDVGSNAKMNELQALMGLCCLNKIEDLLDWRRKVYDAYAEVFNQLEKVGGDGQRNVRLLPYSANHAYIPVIFDSFETRERVYTELKEKCNVYARRYFYPLLTDFAPYVYARGTCPIAEDIAKRVLTLPTYYGLAPEDAKSMAANVLEMI